MGAQKDERDFGTTLAGLGGSFLGAGSSGAGTVLNYDRQNRQDSFAAGANTAASTYAILRDLIGGFKGKGGDGTTNNGSTALRFFGGSGGFGA